MKFTLWKTNAILLLLGYLGYAIGRFPKLRISSMYVIFTFATLIPLLFTLLERASSHFGNFEMDDKLGLAFHTAKIGGTFEAWISPSWSRMDFNLSYYL
jgi:hypothetical protein